MPVTVGVVATRARKSFCFLFVALLCIAHLRIARKLRSGRAIRFRGYAERPVALHATQRIAHGLRTFPAVSRPFGECLLKNLNK